MLKEVLTSAHVEAGIKRNHRAFPLPENLKILGGDTETYRGHPHTVQVCSGPSGAVTVDYVTDETILPTFCARVLAADLRPGGVNVIYFHNLHFDLPVLLFPYHRELYEQVSDIELYLSPTGERLGPKWYEVPDQKILRVLALFGKVNAARFEWGRHWLAGEEERFDVETRLYLLDSAAFTHASLSRSLEMFQIPEVKLPRPDGIGTTRIKGPEFEAYAAQDAVAVRALGCKILDLHDTYKVRPSVSLPQFAGRVFRHHFMDETDVIQFPSEEVKRAAELSYHGGKNGLYVPPGVYEDCVEVDINSAYPWAMGGLPDFIRGNYRRVEGYAGGLAGIYCLSGTVNPSMRYPLIFDHAFKRVNGDFEDVWTTSYETALARVNPDITLTKMWGYVWEPSGVVGRNPFREYVDNFYRLKETTPKTDPNYNFYKLCLNGFYGKLVATVEQQRMEYVRCEDGEEMVVRSDYTYDSVLDRYVKTEKTHVAGGLYNPFVATLITGAVRAKLWELEVKYEALHSATDSIKTLKPIEELKGLGGWKKEVKGRCYLFRNKLYLHYDGEDAKENRGEAAGLRDGGQPLRKYGMHGFKGKLNEFHKARRELLEKGGLAYEYLHVVGLREGLRRKETPGNFVMRPELLLLNRPKRA